MNMINVRRLTVMTFLGAGMLSGISAQVSPLQVDTLKETKIPAQWDFQSCIDYAKEQNITIRKNRITAASTQIDVKTAKAALLQRGSRAGPAGYPYVSVHNKEVPWRLPSSYGWR